MSQCMTASAHTCMHTLVTAGKSAAYSVQLDTYNKDSCNKANLDVGLPCRSCLCQCQIITYNMLWVFLLIADNIHVCTYMYECNCNNISLKHCCKRKFSMQPSSILKCTSGQWPWLSNIARPFVIGCGPWGPCLWALWACLWAIVGYLGYVGQTGHGRQVEVIGHHVGKAWCTTWTLRNANRLPTYIFPTLTTDHRVYHSVSQGSVKICHQACESGCVYCPHISLPFQTIGF